MSEDKFTYSYSPAKNSEADRIAAKYISVPKKPDSDLDRLKRLDRKAELPLHLCRHCGGAYGCFDTDWRCDTAPELFALCGRSSSGSSWFYSGGIGYACQQGSHKTQP